jgi:hypothetical protein
MANETPTIKELLNKYGEVKIKAKDGKFSLVKNDSRFYFCANGWLVGISEDYLDEIISRLPANIGIIGYE